MVEKIFLGLVVEMKFYVYYVYTVQRRTLYAIKAFKGLFCFFMQKLHKEEENYGGTKTSPGLIFKNI